MTQLINLLSWQPGHSGFGSYVQRVLPGIPGIRCSSMRRVLFVDSVRPMDDTGASLAPGRAMRFYSAMPWFSTASGLGAYCIVLICAPVIYSPFFDAFWHSPRFLS